ncbi:unnamed protein product [Hermetia illucens]|uniref:Uncharacterized protein n=1 Tax=Hermetia illucens TaxID=343691 RepID=A0A7R8UTN7_HERIL|nr:unnamed protein product [Hermetia illucens]
MEEVVEYPHSDHAPLNDVGPYFEHAPLSDVENVSPIHDGNHDVELQNNQRPMVPEACHTIPNAISYYGQPADHTIPSALSCYAQPVEEVVDHPHFEHAPLNDVGPHFEHAPLNDVGPHFEHTPLNDVGNASLILDGNRHVGLESNQQPMVPEACHAVPSALPCYEQPAYHTIPSALPYYSQPVETVEQVVEYPHFQHAPLNDVGHVSLIHGGNHHAELQNNQQPLVPEACHTVPSALPSCGQPAYHQHDRMQNYGVRPYTLQNHENLLHVQHRLSGHYQSANIQWQSACQKHSVGMNEYRPHSVPTVGVQYIPMNAFDVPVRHVMPFCHNSQSWNHRTMPVQHISGIQVENLAQSNSTVQQSDNDIPENMYDVSQTSVINLAVAEDESFQGFPNTIEDLGDLNEILADHTKSEGILENCIQHNADDDLGQLTNEDISELPRSAVEIPNDTMDGGIVQSEHHDQNLTQHSPGVLRDFIGPDEIQLAQNVPAVPQDLTDVPEDQLTVDIHVAPQVLVVECQAQSDRITKGETQDECTASPLLENISAYPAEEILEDGTNDDHRHIDTGKRVQDRYDYATPIPSLSEDEIYIRRLLDESEIKAEDGIGSTVQSEPDGNVCSALENIYLPSALPSDNVDFSFQLTQPRVDMMNATACIYNGDNNVTNSFPDEPEEECILTFL